MYHFFPKFYFDIFSQKRGYALVTWWIWFLLFYVRFDNFLLVSRNVTSFRWSLNFDLWMTPRVATGSISTPAPCQTKEEWLFLRQESLGFCFFRDDLGFRGHAPRYHESYCYGIKCRVYMKISDFSVWVKNSIDWEWSAKFT